MGVGAGGRASRTARMEFFVGLALRDGEEHVRMSSFASARLHANAARISQKSIFAETTDDAISGADRTGMGIGAGGRTSRTARMEFFVVRAFGSGLAGKLHGNVVVTSLALLRANAFAFRILQESLRTETTDDALEGTHLGRLGIGAIGNASGSAIEELGIGTAFFIDREGRKSRSEFESAKAEQ